MHGDAICPVVEAHQPVAPANVETVLAGPLGKSLHQPGLLDGEHEHLRIRNTREIQRKGGEHSDGDG